MIQDLIPKDKHDISSINELMSLNDEEIDEIIPDLLEWIQDMNWPVSSHIINVLASHRKAVERYLPTLLKPEQKDEEWKRNIIQYLLCEWVSFSEDECIKNEIIRIAVEPTDSEIDEGVNIAAGEYLKNFA